MKTKETKIFIVEDDKFFGKLVKELLTNYNYKNVQLYSTGEDCLANIYTAPDIVILDHGLEKMNGLDVLKKIKSINPNIQVIFLSAQEKMNVAITSLKYGAYDYLEKDAEGIQRLVHLVKRIVSNNKILIENRRYKRLKRWSFLGVSIGLFLLIYLSITNS